MLCANNIIHGVFVLYLVCYVFVNYSELLVERNFLKIAFITGISPIKWSIDSPIIINIVLFGQHSSSAPLILDNCTGKRSQYGSDKKEKEC